MIVLNRLAVILLAVLITGCPSRDPASRGMLTPVGSRTVPPLETGHVERYLSAIEQAELFGFNREDFQYSILRAGPSAPDEKFAAMLEDSFRTFTRSLIRGRIDPRAVGAGWERSENSKELDTAGLVARFFRGEPIDYESLNPQDIRFNRLVEALRFYRQLEKNGGWPRLPTQPTHDELAGRLVIEGDLRGDSSEAGPVLEALRGFQTRHGLESDGVLGSRTLAALNVPVSERIRQIELNIERWRWMPRVLEANYVEMNIPSFELTVYDQQRPVFTTKTIVGTSTRPTPVLRSEITAMEINPDWDVPESIAAHELLPILKRKPEYLSTNHMIVLDKRRNEVQAPQSWGSYSAENFPFRLRQIPGPWNSVGPLKFIFASGYGVYLHGTPAKELFNKVSRRFSHGCIRLEDPLGLAERIFSGSEWGREDIQALLDSGKMKTISLAKPEPLYLSYWTAFVGEDGAVHFADDIYDGDIKLDRLLEHWHHQRSALYRPRMVL